MPSEVPEGWSWARLGDQCQIEIGGTPKRKEPIYWDAQKTGSNVWLSISDLGDQKVIEDSSEYISDVGVANSSVKLVEAGTVLMSFKLSIGRMAIAGRDLYTNEAIAAFSPDESAIDNDYLFYILPKAADTTTAFQAVKGKTLNKGKLNDLPVLLPPLPEQKKIAAILSSVDECIQATQAVIDQTRRVKKGLLQDLLTRGIGDTRFKPVEGWVIGRLPEISSYQSPGKSFDSQMLLAWSLDTRHPGKSITTGMATCSGQASTTPNAWRNMSWRRRR